MGRLVLTGLPEPDFYWCAVCCALLKGLMFADDGTQRRAQEGLADDGRALVVIAAPESLRPREHLQEAVTMAPSTVVGGGIPVPLCWTHAPLIDGTAPPPGGPGDAPSPGLLRGRG